MVFGQKIDEARRNPGAIEASFRFPPARQCVSAWTACAATGKFVGILIGAVSDFPRLGLLSETNVYPVRGVSGLTKMVGELTRGVGGLTKMISELTLGVSGLTKMISELTRGVSGLTKMVPELTRRVSELTFFGFSQNFP